MKTVLAMVSMDGMSIIFMMISMAVMVTVMSSVMISVVATLKMRSLVEWKLVD